MSLLSMPDHARHPAARDAASSTGDATVRRMTSRRLLGGGREVVIEHHGSEYHLRLTRNDKLILTK